MQFSLLIFVALGGALGASLRYCINQLSLHHLGDGFYATLTVNLIGCFLIGIFSESLLRLSQHHLLSHWSPYLSALLVTGLLGGFTTFSSFALDTLGIKGEFGPWLSLTYVALSVVGGIALAQFGRFLVTLP